MLIADSIALTICLFLLWQVPGLGESCFAWIENKFAGFARNTARSKSIALLTIGATCIFLRVVLWIWIPVPDPQIHDEYGYLLAADTFIHGRLANPPHPLWMFFDTYHVIQHPTYASVYPPAQGAMLAVGTLLGHPWIGVLLSTAAMCVAMTWMLQGWMPAEWALLGGTLVLFRFGIFSYWMNSYWGGSITAVGAALVMGALPRIIEHQRLRDALLLGLGAGILATSRPLEGFIFCIPVAAALLWWCLLQSAVPGNIVIKRVLLPLASVLVCIVGFIAYYNWRVTGNPALFPPVIEERAYFTAPVFLWQQAKAPLTYANHEFDIFYNHWMPSLYQTGWNGAKTVSLEKLSAFWNFFLGPALSIPLLAIPWLLRDRKTRLLLIQAVLSSAGLLAVVWFHPHYAAPIGATVLLLVMLGLRHLHAWRYRDRPVGAALVRLIVLFSILIGPVYFVISRSPSFSAYLTPALGGLPAGNVLYFIGAGLVLIAAVLFLLNRRSNRTAQPSAERTGVFSYLEFAFLILALILMCIGQRALHPDSYPFDVDVVVPPRAPVEQILNPLPGQQLVLVRYSVHHNIHEEYVYNDADIDNAKIVWAREIPGMDLTPLLTYFKSRYVWVLEPDEDPVRLNPYSQPSPAP